MAVWCFPNPNPDPDAEELESFIVAGTFFTCMRCGTLVDGTPPHEKEACNEALVRSIMES